MTNLNENNIDFNFNLKIVEALIFASPEPVSFNELKKSYGGITNILEIWFANYKGSNKIIINGFDITNEIHTIFSNII